MASVSRSAIFGKIHKVLKKYYKPVAPPAERTVLEHLLFACVLEDARYEPAEEAFAALRHTFYDWNEVRVTSISELSEVMAVLPDPRAAANRIKRVLHSIFEELYCFDLEEKRKKNLGPTVKWLEKMDGTTRFVVAYVVQAALDGHSIPLDTGTLAAFASWTWWPTRKRPPAKCRAWNGPSPRARAWSSAPCCISSAPITWPIRSRPRFARSSWPSTPRLRSGSPSVVSRARKPRRSRPQLLPKPLPPPPAATPRKKKTEAAAPAKPGGRSQDGGRRRASRRRGQESKATAGPPAKARLPRRNRPKARRRLAPRARKRRKPRTNRRPRRSRRTSPGETARKALQG